LKPAKEYFRSQKYKQKNNSSACLENLLLWWKKIMKNEQVRLLSKKDIECNTATNFAQFHIRFDW